MMGRYGAGDSVLAMGGQLDPSATVVQPPVTVSLIMASHPLICASESTQGQASIPRWLRSSASSSHFQVVRNKVVGPCTLMPASGHLEGIPGSAGGHSALA